jgi:hypothetical protein
VQTGDIVDRGRDTIALYRLFDTLRVQAQDSGGEVISLLGNHEVRFWHWHEVPSSLIPSADIWYLTAHERNGRLAICHKGTLIPARPNAGPRSDSKLSIYQDDIATFGGEESRRKAFSSGWIGQVHSIRSFAAPNGLVI